MDGVDVGRHAVIRRAIIDKRVVIPLGMQVGVDPDADRDRRVELFQAQSRVTELYLRNLERRLQKLRDEASSYQPYSEDTNAPMIDEGLAAELQKTRETINRHQRNLQKFETDERLIVERFDGDIARFKRLKGIETTANNVSGSNST